MWDGKKKIFQDKNGRANTGSIFKNNHQRRKPINEYTNNPHDYLWVEALWVIIIVLPTGYWIFPIFYKEHLYIYYYEIFLA